MGLKDSEGLGLQAHIHLVCALPTLLGARQGPRTQPGGGAK